MEALIESGSCGFALSLPREFLYWSSAEAHLSGCRANV